jgi:D-3-phosphoglycerate dehydrogenase
VQGLGNVILTPHIGGSTEEAQERIGGEVARKLVDYFITGSTMGAVNFPEVQLHLHPSGARFSHVHRNVPGMLRRLNEVFLQRDINIVAQYLETAGDLGYVVLDAELAGQDSAALLQQIRSLEGTVGARLVFEH